MNKEQEILEYVLKNTSLRLLNHALKNYHLQAIYNNHKNALLRMYFNDNNLKYSVTMRKIFNQFQTSVDEGKASAISGELYFLDLRIKRLKKWNQPHKEEVTRYNKLVDELNELNKGIKKLVSLYKKLQQSKTT